MNYDRNIIQFLPDSARYDPILAYTLKPGSSTVENREHTVTYFVNELGVRDDEESLKGPTIVVIGDSHAMGWGVEQDETFASIIEKRLKVRTLNTGISSYGTARELMMLNRVNTEKTKYLIIQYSDNDSEENKIYVQSRFKLRVLSEDSYKKLVEDHVNRDRTPYSYIYVMYRILHTFVTSEFKPGVPVVQSPNAEIAARFFLASLAHCKVNNIQLILLEINSFDKNNSKFVHQVEKFINSHTLPDFIEKMKIIDTSAFLEEDDYYILDDHMRPVGHEKVAEAIIKVINDSDS